VKALAPVRTADPVNAILSTADAKAHLKIEHSDEDDLVAAYVAAATGYLDGPDGVLGLALIEQTWSQSFDCFPCRRWFHLAFGPLLQVEAISYFDPDGQEQEFTGFRAVSDATGPMVMLNEGESWPATAVRSDAVTVEWTCGFGPDDIDLPQPIVHAARLLIGDWHLNRENTNVGNITSELPFAVKALLAPFRKVRI
jgi:uncharacterized phiE125 gp8 family phage protein